jgi:transcriptional regulator with XRE-family HTH domain
MKGRRAAEVEGTTQARPPAPPFGRLLRQWRDVRRMSQLELALQAEVSSRHVSFLETGRSQPSRAMVVRLSQVLDLPLRAMISRVRAPRFVDSVDGEIRRVLDEEQPVRLDQIRRRNVIIRREVIQTTRRGRT